MTMPPLGEYDGQPIVKTTARLVKTSAVLSEAMSLDPSFLHIGQPVMLVIGATVYDVRLKPVDDAHPDGDLVQMATFVAVDAAMVDDASVEQLLAVARENAARAKGNEPLPGMSVSEQDLFA